MGQVCSSICNRLFGRKEPGTTENKRNSIFFKKRHIEVEEQPDDGLLEIVNVENNRTVSQDTVNESVLEYAIYENNRRNVYHGDDVVSADVAPQNKVQHLRDRFPFSDSSQVYKKIKVDDYLNFPILKDSRTKTYINKSKVCIILRGLSGSGKSFIGAALCELYGTSAVECSADQYFVQEDGSYKFDASLLGQAHKSCSDNAEAAMVRHCPLVLVNNTNVKYWEYKKYLSLAKKHHYTVLIIEPHTPWAWDPELLAHKTQHGLTLEVLKIKLSQFQQNKPIYYGWFVNPADSCLLVQQGFDCLRKVVGLVECRETLTDLCRRQRRKSSYNYTSSTVIALSDVDNYVAADNTSSATDADASSIAGEATESPYYQQCGPKGVFQPVHCTAMFTNRGKAVGGQEYMARPAVAANTGRAYDLLVVGFVVTPRTISARVLLPEQLCSLWGQDEEPHPELPSNIAHHYSSTQDTNSPMDTNIDDSYNFFKDKDLYASVPEITGSSTTVETISFEDVKRICGSPTMDQFQPVLKRGRKAHITLAVAPSVEAMVTGYDLLDLQRREQQAQTVDNDTTSVEDMDTCEDGVSAPSNTAKRTIYKVENGTLADYGDGVFAIYLDNCIQVTSLYSTFCSS